MKNAILILSDPRSGSDESSGRLFNALAAAYDLQRRKHTVSILFQGAGTRWPALLSQPEHPFHDSSPEFAPQWPGLLLPVPLSSGRATAPRPQASTY